MDQVTQQNAALVEEGANAAEQLADQADRLTSLVAVFKLDKSSALQQEQVSPEAVPIVT